MAMRCALTWVCVKGCGYAEEWQVHKTEAWLEPTPRVSKWESWASSPGQSGIQSNTINTMNVLWFQGPSGQSLLISRSTAPQNQPTYLLYPTRNVLNPFHKGAVGSALIPPGPIVPHPHPIIPGLAQLLPGTQFCWCPASMSELPGWSRGPHLPFLQLFLVIQELFSDLFGGSTTFFPMVLLEILHHQPTHLGQKLLKSPHLGP